MSHTFEIGCDQCGDSLWIGQGWPGGRTYIYRDNAKVMEGLQAFLFAHQGHPLRFLDSQDAPDEWRREDEEAPPEMRARPTDTLISADLSKETKGLTAAAQEFAAQLVPIYIVEDNPASGASPLDIENMLSRLRDHAGDDAANRVEGWLKASLAKGPVAKEDLRAEIVEAMG